MEELKKSAGLKKSTLGEGGNDSLNLITNYISDEDWDYTRVGISNGNYLEIQMFNGRLRLHSDSTWSYKV